MIQSRDRKKLITVRYLLGTLVFMLSLAIPILSSGRAFAGEKPSQATASRDTAAAKETTTERPAFDLTYVPPDATGVIAIRPNVIFSHPAMKPLAGIAAKSPLVGMLLLPYFPFADLNLPLQEVEQIIAFAMTSPLASPHDKNASGFTLATVMIRAAHDFDWLKQMRRIDPKTEEIRCGDRAYYRSHPKRGKGDIWSEMSLSSKATFAYFIPDKRTVVFLSVPTGLRAYRKAEPLQRAHFSWDKDWKHVENSLIAWAVDNRSAGRESKNQQSEDPFAELTALTRKTTAMTGGVEWKEGVALRIYLDYKESAAAKRAIPGLKTFLKQARRDFEQNTPDVPDSPDTPKWAREAMDFQLKLSKGLIDHVHIMCAESTVCVHTRAKMTVIEAAKGIMPWFGTFATSTEMAPARK